MKITYNRKFQQDLEKLRDQKVKRALKERILQLQQAQSLLKVTGVKKIAGHPEAFRIRIGGYRLGFFSNSREVRIQRFLKRNDIYKVFP